MWRNWRWWDQSRINDRIDALETSQERDPTKLQLDYLDDEVSSLRASQGGFKDQLEHIQQELESTRQAVAEGISLVTRTDNRIKATLARAKKEFAKHGFESPGLDAEDHELRLIDGEGGEERWVPPVREEVAEPARLAPKEFAVRAKFFGT